MKIKNKIFKKIIIYCFGSLILIGVGLGANFIYQSQIVKEEEQVTQTITKTEYDDKKYHKIFEGQKFEAKIQGAVKKPGKYIFKYGLTLREILSQAKIDTKANLKKIDLEKIPFKNIDILVPFKNEEINNEKLNGENIDENEENNKSLLKWSQLKNEEQLIKKGISKNIAAKIILHKQKNKTTTWQQINEIKGIGLKNILLLKKVIELD